MKRRRFLKQTASLTASWLAIRPHNSTAIAKAGTSDRKKSIRIGVITQKAGPHLSIYLKALAATGGISRIAISDTSGTTFALARETLGNKFADLETFRDHDQMLNRFRPDLSLVSLEAHLSPNPIRKALEGGSHVLSEKPACVRAEDFSSLVQLSESKNLHLMLSLPGRLSPSSLKSKDLVKKDFLGKIYAVHAFQVKDQTRLTRPSYQKSWYAFKDKAGGGHLIWLGIHTLDLIQHLIDDQVLKVSAISRNVGGQPVEIEDSEAVVFQFRSGIVGTFHGGYYLKQGGFQSSYTLWGSKGWLRWNSSRHNGHSRNQLEWYSTDPEAPQGIQQIVYPKRVNTYQLLVEASVEAARGIGKAPISGRDCLHVLEVIHGAYRASETGKTQIIG